jgi:hypothetical protein
MADKALGAGGCFYNKGTLVVEDCTLQGNASFGGSIYNDGTGTNDGDLTVNDCTIICAGTGCLGGGIYTDVDDTITVEITETTTIKDGTVDMDGGRGSLSMMVR